MDPFFAGNSSNYVKYQLTVLPTQKEVHIRLPYSSPGGGLERFILELNFRKEEMTGVT